MTSSAPSRARSLPALGLAIGLLIITFGKPLWSLARHAAGSDLDSYILLVPLLAAVAFAFRRKSLSPPSPPHFAVAAVLAAIGVVALGAPTLGRVPDTSALSFKTLSFVAFAAALCAGFLGRRTMGALAFPLAFMLFAVPLPGPFFAWVEHGLEWSSAAIASVFFDLSGLPVFRASPLEFQIPGITITVAPECSGINSSMALFILSWPMAFIVLRSPWRRALVIAAVVPLGILRNGFRIWVVAELCAHWGPQMIDSYLHRHGGWIFFLLSLIPFLALLILMARSEGAAGRNNHPKLP